MIEYKNPFPYFYVYFCLPSTPPHTVNNHCFWTISFKTLSFHTNGIHFLCARILPCQLMFDVYFKKITEEIWKISMRLNQV